MAGQILTPRELILDKKNIIKVYCRDLNRYGQAVCVELDAKDEPEDGKSIIFANGLLPGESGLVTVVDVRKNYRMATLTRRKDDSPDRVEMSCPIAGDCGGCQIQALSYPAGLSWKENDLRQTLKRIGDMELEAKIRPIVGSDQPFAHYRNKVVYPVGGSDAEPQLGFYRARSHDLLTTPVCLIEPHAGGRLRVLIAELMKKHGLSVYDEKTHKGDLRFVTLRVAPETALEDEPVEQMVILTSRTEKDAYFVLAKDLLQEPGLVSVYLNIQAKPGNVILGDKFILLGGEEKLSFTLDGSKFSLSPGAFFQVNYEQTIRLYRLIAKLTKAIHLENNLTAIIDLYCGVGSIGLYVLNELRKDEISSLPHLLGIEIVEQAVTDAKDNAELNDWDETDYDFIHADAADSLEYLRKADSEKTLVIVDPPRKGLDKEVLSTLVVHGPSHLLYVSCNPATLARDLKELTTKYKVDLVQPLDMFPWTTHVETVVLMSRVEK